MITTKTIHIVTSLLWFAMTSSDLTRADFEAYYRAVVPNAVNHGQDELRTRCPIHNGNSDTSFSVNLTNGLWKCWSDCSSGGDVFNLEMQLRGCTFPEAVKGVYEIIGRTPPPFEGSLKPRPLTKFKPHLKPYRVTATYVYTDEAGEPLYRVVRKEYPAVGNEKPKKEFSQQTPREGGWSGASGNMKDVRRVPYRLPQLLAAKEAGDWIWFCEGEKATESLVKLGLTATTSAGGAVSGWKKYRHFLNPHFAGARLVILPDNDPAGRNHALMVADNLLSLAHEIKIVELPDLPEHGDVVDWLASGGTVKDLAKLANATPSLDAALFSAYQRQWSEGPKAKKSERLKPIDSRNKASSEHHNEPPAGQIEEEPPTGQDQQQRDKLTHLLQARVLRFVQIGSEVQAARYRLETSKGNIRFEHFGQIVQYREFKRIAGPVLKYVIPIHKEQEWNEVVNDLLSIQVVEQTDPEAQPTGAARAWLIDYLQGNMRHANWDAALKADETDRKLPHFEGERICISADHARNWCAKHRNEIFTYNRLSEILADLGAEPFLKATRRPKSNITFYRLPSDFQASDYQLDPTTATPAMETINTDYIV